MFAATGGCFTYDGDCAMVSFLSRVAFRRGPIVQFVKVRLLERARRNRYRAETCRDLIRLTSSTKSATLLREFAEDLDARARDLESRAREHSRRLAQEHFLAAGARGDDTAA